MKKKLYGMTLAKELIHRFRSSQVSLVASSLAYTTLLSMIPALALSFAIFQIFGGVNRVYSSVEPFLLTHLTAGTGIEVTRTLQRLIGNIHGKTLGVGGFLGLIVTTITMLWSFEGAVNRIWNVPMKRNLIFRFTSYGLFLTLGPLALSILLGVASSSYIPLAKLFPRGAGLFILSVMGFYFVYEYVPHCKVERRLAFFAALMTGIVWNLARGGYGLYIRNVVNYKSIYGSLAAIPILLLWIYILWLITLGGVVLTAALQEQLVKKKLLS